VTGAGPRRGAGAPAPVHATPPDRPVALRPARADDAAVLARIDAATSTQPWSAATFRTELDRPDRSYVVACAVPGDGAGAGAGAGAGDGARDAAGEDDKGDGEVVGYAGLAFIAGDAHVMGIAVLPSAQGRGYGRLLLTAVCREAADADAAMTLEVRPSNAVARHLYRSLGFIEAGRRPGYYPDGEDALILWRQVADPAATSAAGTTTVAAAAAPAEPAEPAEPAAQAAPAAQTATTNGG
jgi:[ribosomal protein S18]-alanine N-acetyltransferase